QQADGWRVAGRWDPETHVGALSLMVPDPITPQDLGAILDASFDIAVRPGLHCAPYIHRRLGTFPNGTLRISPAPFRRMEDLSALLAAWTKIPAKIAGSRTRLVGSSRRVRAGRTGLKPGLRQAAASFTSNLARRTSSALSRCLSTNGPAAR